VCVCVLIIALQNNNRYSELNLDTIWFGTHLCCTLTLKSWYNDKNASQIFLTTDAFYILIYDGKNCQLSQSVLIKYL